MKDEPICVNCGKPGAHRCDTCAKMCYAKPTKPSQAVAFRLLVSNMERERGHRIGGFALDEKTGQWKIITPGGKVTLLEKTKND